jgi:hypothetical protein
MYRRGTDWTLVGTVVAVVVIAALLVFGLWSEYESDKACTAAGGHEAITGYSVISTGKTVTVTPEYTCEGAH